MFVPAGDRRFCAPDFHMRKLFGRAAGSTYEGFAGCVYSRGARDGYCKVVQRERIV